MAVAGFYGKLPARGDFLRAGLPRGFIGPWDEWLQRVLGEAARACGDGWRDAWLAAPIWQFAIGTGLCSCDAALGVLLPSVDRAARCFPLTIAAVMEPTELLLFASRAPAFLRAAAEAGVDAVLADLPPEVLALRLTAALSESEAGGDHAFSSPEEGCSLWWAGSSDQVLKIVGLPNAMEFAEMFAEGAVP
jgi:type VI secretion system protein ImpM